MEKEIIFTVEESKEGGFEARALGFPIFTEADTFEDLKKMVQDAVICHFEEGARPRLFMSYIPLAVRPFVLKSESISSRCPLFFVSTVNITLVFPIGRSPANLS